MADRELVHRQFAWCHDVCGLPHRACQCYRAASTPPLGTVASKLVHQLAWVGIYVTSWANCICGQRCTCPLPCQWSNTCSDLAAKLISHPSLLNIVVVDTDISEWNNLTKAKWHAPLEYRSIFRVLFDKFGPLPKLMPHLAPWLNYVQIWPPRSAPKRMEPNLCRSAPSSLEPTPQNIWLQKCLGADLHKFGAILVGADLRGQICK